MATSTTVLSNDEYRQVKAWSNSDLANISKSAATVEWSRNAKSDYSDAGIIGTAVHAYALEPDEFKKDYVKMPDFNRSTNAGKAKVIEFTDSMQGKIILPHADYNLVVAMGESLMAHPTINRLLTSKGESEVSIFFEIDGVKGKARTDRIVDPSVFNRHIIVDVKTTADVDKFVKSMRTYRYHCQDAWYTDAYEALTGHKPQFLFAVVGRSKVFGRHPVRLIELDQEGKDEGRAQYLADLEKVKEYEAFGIGELEVETVSLGRNWD